MDDVTLLAWIERGKNIAAFLVAIGVAGEFFGDFMAGPIVRRRGEAQRAEIAQLNERAARAEAETSRLNREAGEARRAAGDAIERAGKANERAAENEKQAAQLRKEAEQERLARLKIEERIGPRTITEEQGSKLVRELTPLIGRNINVFVISGDPETTGFANALVPFIQKAGIAVNVAQGMIVGTVQAGITLTIGDNRRRDAEILSGALIDAGLADKPIAAHRADDANMLQITIAPKKR